MADKPINLRLRRKQRARDEKRRQGDAAAAGHGVRKSDRERAAAVADLDARRFEGHRLDPAPSDDGE